MPAPKSLTQHVVDGTFRPSRHHELLAGPAVGWPALAASQGTYVAATSESERRAAAVTFLGAVRRLADCDAEKADSLTDELERILNAPPVRIRL